MQGRKELTKAVRGRYEIAGRNEKILILDEFVKTTGYHRKHALRLMNQVKTPVPKTEARRIYDEAVREALTVVWEAGDRMCGKRLKAALPGLVVALEGHGHLNLAAPVRAKLMAVSPATIDRLLQPIRESAGRKRRRPRKPNSIQRKVPIRTHRDSDKLAPGFFEVDFVVHNGGIMPGSCVHTFTLTDVCSGWTECFALVARQQMLVVEALELICPQLPIPMLGFDSDNDGAFLNEAVYEYLKKHNLKQTRSRPYKSNDQAWVEQKNGSVVRHFAGYDRFEGLSDTMALARLYKHVRLYVNYFQPSFKLKEKRREGAKVKKFYHLPKTPCNRLLDNPTVSEEIKASLLKTRSLLDPVNLLHRIREAQAALKTPRKCIGTDLEQFLKQLSVLWKDGEVSPVHRVQAKTKTPRTYRTRLDPFESSWVIILGWLATEPELGAREILIRLEKELPEQYSTRHLRTLQRRIKDWRHQQARALVYAGASSLTNIEMANAETPSLQTDKDEGYGQSCGQQPNEGAPDHSFNHSPRGCEPVGV